MTAAEEQLSALWRTTLQGLADRTAHDIRNALNGVAVNLEVVRSRSARGSDGSLVAPFAASAAAELERVTAQADALVGLVRSAGERADVGVLLARFGAFLRGPGDPPRLTVDLPSDSGRAETAVSDAARVALGTALLRAIDREGTISCRLRTEPAPTVYIECGAGGPLSLADDVAAAVQSAGITLAPTANGIAISFPPAPTG
jgi:hypothetical protein